MTWPWLLYAVLVEFFDRDNKDNPYEDLTFTIGPFSTDKRATRVASSLTNSHPDLDFIGVTGKVIGHALNSLPEDHLLEAAQARVDAMLGDISGEFERSLRKPHVKVDQDYYREWVYENGPTTLGDFIDIFDVSESTARRQLDGLVVQGKLERVEPSRGQRLRAIYKVPQQKE